LIPCLAVEEKIAQFRQLFADAPEYAKTGVTNVIDELKSQVVSKPPASRMVSAGCAGSRQGKVSELTLIVPLAPGGAQRLRAFLQLLDGDFDGADKAPGLSMTIGKGKRPRDPTSLASGS
jgi:hypothetical protein